MSWAESRWYRALHNDQAGNGPVSPLSKFLQIHINTLNGKLHVRTKGTHKLEGSGRQHGFH